MAKRKKRGEGSVHVAKKLAAQGKIDEAMALASGKKPRGTRRKESRL